MEAQYPLDDNMTYQGNTDGMTMPPPAQQQSLAMTLAYEPLHFTGAYNYDASVYEGQSFLHQGEFFDNIITPSKLSQGLPRTDQSTAGRLRTLSRILSDHLAAIPLTS